MAEICQPILRDLTAKREQIAEICRQRNVLRLRNIYMTSSKPVSSSLNLQQRKIL